MMVIHPTAQSASGLGSPSLLHLSAEQGHPLYFSLRRSGLSFQVLGFDTHVGIFTLYSLRKQALPYQSRSWEERQRKL